TLEGSPADKVGLKSGDRIVRIDGIENPTWEKVLYKEALSANQPLNLQIERDHSVFSMTVVPAATHDGGGQAGWGPAEPNTVSDLDPKMPAAKAGLRVGDDVVALNGEVVRSTNAVLRFLKNNKDAPVVVTFHRNGQEMKATVVPVLSSPDPGGEARYRI